jgi:hypothetical protein
MEGGSEVAATATATEEPPSAPKASGEPAAGCNALAVRAAARLSAELALAALVALAAACAFDLATTQVILSGATRGSRLFHCFYGVDYVHRAAVIVYLEPDSISRRHREINVAWVLSAFVLMCSWPLAYIQYLGASRRAFGAMVGVIALSYSFLELGYVVLGVQLFGQYQTIIGSCVFTLVYACSAPAALRSQGRR